MGTTSRVDNPGLQFHATSFSCMCLGFDKGFINHHSCVHPWPINNGFGDHHVCTHFWFIGSVLCEHRLGIHLRLIGSDISCISLHQFLCIVGIPFSLQCCAPLPDMANLATFPTCLLG